jgi:hypothetical protein
MTEVVDRMRCAHKANCVEQRWKNVKDDEHGGVKEHLQKNARPN